MRYSRKRLYVQGARDTLPLVIAASPFGVVYGAMAKSINLDVVEMMAMSVLVFSGSAQFITVTLLASSAAVPVIILTVFIVNLRHLLYSASLAPHIKSTSHWLRLPIAFWLTDETYAVVSQRLENIGPNHLTDYYLGSGLFMYVNWCLMSWLGFRLSSVLPELSNWGLEVAMMIAFIGIVVPLITRASQLSCALTALVSGVLTCLWPHKTGLLFSAVLAMSIGVLLEKRN